GEPVRHKSRAPPHPTPRARPDFRSGRRSTLPDMRDGEAAGILHRLATGRPDRLTHVEKGTPRPGRTGPWPRWVPAEVIARLNGQGIDAPWTHQVATAD